MIYCVVLAAGLSSRFHSPKALADYNGRPVINHILKTILNTHINGIQIILGAHKEILEPQILKHTHISIVYNKDYNLGQTSSFQAGVRSLPKDTTGIILWPVDFPFIQPSTINQMIEIFHHNKDKIIIPSFQNRKGHPAFFCASLKEDILSLDHNKGINTLIHNHANNTTVLPVNDEGVLLSFNTQEEWRALQDKIK